MLDGKTEDAENEEEKPQRDISLQREISVEAHKYFLENTTFLTNFKETDNKKSSSLKFYENCNELSDNPLYLPERDLYREHGNEQNLTQNQELRFDKDHARITHSHSFRRLQGKSQLIPAGENEFFRTRLTHSLEVADIARRIARRINIKHEYFKKNPINLFLITCASLLHDIGHPPFGHSGEEVLDELMSNAGGFEGNAQTLRLVTKLENRLGTGETVIEAYENPRGLNLSARTLAAIIKYDHKIEISKPKLHKPQKGYYESEARTVEFIKNQLNIVNEKLRTIECQIMDIADDIAYSAYDLEDTMEADIVLPFDMISLYDKDLKNIKDDINKGIKKKSIALSRDVDEKEVLETLIKVFGTILQIAEKGDYPNLAKKDKEDMQTAHPDRIVFVGRSYGESILHAKNPLIRRQFLETLIETNIKAITVKLNPEIPSLSKLQINEDRLMVIECLKKFNFHKVIASKKIQMAQHRSKRILKSIFDALIADVNDNKRYLLSDEQVQYFNHNPKKDDKKTQMRFVCDIIANLSDQEAVRLFNKLNGDGNFFEYSF